LGELELDLFELLADLLDVAQPSFSASHCSRRLASLRFSSAISSSISASRSLGVLLGLFGQLPRGQFQLPQPPLHLVDLRWGRFPVPSPAAGRFVDQVDRLVGQEAVGDVAVRQLGRRDQRRVLDLDAVMRLVARLQAAQDGDRVLDDGSPT
jgi:hypothetical protein